MWLKLAKSNTDHHGRSVALTPFTDTTVSYFFGVKSSHLFLTLIQKQSTDTASSLITIKKNLWPSPLQQSSRSKAQYHVAGWTHYPQSPSKVPGYLLYRSLTFKKNCKNIKKKVHTRNNFSKVFGQALAFSVGEFDRGFGEMWRVSLRGQKWRVTHGTSYTASTYPDRE